MRVKEGNKEADIYKAALKIFAQKGYHNSKVSDIAAEAGIAAGSVYLYYKNKEDILIQIFSKIWNGLIGRLLSIKEETSLSPLEKIDNLIDSFFNVFSGNSDLAIVYAAEHRNALQISEPLVTLYNRFLDSAEDFVEEGKKAGLIDENINVKIFRCFLLGGMRLLIDSASTEPGSYGFDKARSSVKLIVRSGITAR